VICIVIIGAVVFWAWNCEIELREKTRGGGGVMPMQVDA